MVITYMCADVRGTSFIENGLWCCNLYHNNVFEQIEAEFLTLGPLYPISPLLVARIVKEVPTSCRGVFLTLG